MTSSVRSHYKTSTTSLLLPSGWKPTNCGLSGLLIQYKTICTGLRQERSTDRPSINTVNTCQSRPTLFPSYHHQQRTYFQLSVLHTVTNTVNMPRFRLQTSIPHTCRGSYFMLHTIIKGNTKRRSAIGPIDKNGTKHTPTPVFTQFTVQFVNKYYFMVCCFFVCSCGLFVWLVGWLLFFCGFFFFFLCGGGGGGGG